MIDLAVGFLVPYAAVGGFLAIFLSDFDPGKMIFAFVLPILLLIFPFATLSYNPIGIAVILSIAGAFYVVFRFIPPAYGRYAIGLVFVVWGFYGIYCSQWIAA